MYLKSPSCSKSIEIEGTEYENHTIIRAAFVCLFVCLFVCFLSPPRSFGRSSPNLVGVCRRTSHLPLRGSFSKRSTAVLEICQKKLSATRASNF